MPSLTRTVIALVSSDSREGVAETSVGVDAASAGSEPSSISCIVHDATIAAAVVTSWTSRSLVR